MYNVAIKTKYNIIHLQVEDLNSPEFIEICEQPYVEEIRAEQIKKDDENAREQNTEGYNSLSKKKKSIPLSFSSSK